MKKIILAAAIASGTFVPMASYAQSTPAYSIETRSQGEQMTGTASTSSTANTNTSVGDVRDTIAANPGLAEALQAEGVSVDEIGAISVLPNSQVVVYKK